MSQVLRDAWARGADVREVLAVSVAQRFYKLIELDAFKEREDRMAVNAQARMELVDHFNKFLGIQTVGPNVGKDKEIEIIDGGILAQIKAMPIPDVVVPEGTNLKEHIRAVLDPFERDVLRLFTPADGDADNVAAVKKRLSISAGSVIEHYEQFAHLLPKQS